MQKQLVVTNTHAETLEKHSGKISKSLGAISAPAEKSRNSLKHLGEAALAAGGAFAAFEAAKSAIDSTLELGHATERLTAITGLSVKEASTWIETMKVRGVQTKAVSQAFITLSRNIRGAEDGSKTARKAFDQLGISQKDLRTEDTQHALLQVADGLGKIEQPARRAALAQQLFGRGAQGLIPILSEGRKGVEEALKSTQKYGAFLPQNVGKLKAAQDAQHNLNLAMDGLKISFTTAVLPSLVQGAGKLLAFIAQMRSGKGAGGDFAKAISSAFSTVKTVVTNVIRAVGGLGNAVRIAVGAFAAVKIIEFGKALQGLFALMRASPVGLLFTAVGLLAGAFLALSGKQHEAAITAGQVRDAWDKARDAADALRDANLQIVQAKLNHIKADEALTAAQHDVTAAADKYGKNSPQYKDAEQNLAQAKIDSKRASDDLADATKNQTRAQRDATSARKAALDTQRDQVSQDRDRISRISTEIDRLSHLRTAYGHTKDDTAKLTDLRSQLSAATHKLSDDQQALNQKIIEMPGFKLSDINVDVTFASNISNAISLIAKQVGGHFAPLQNKPAFAHHFSGGLVNQPGYFAGEEAPTHPEVILATNPAYRSRNLGLWATAGHMLQVPGFAAGGLTAADATVVGGVPPWASQVAGKWIKPKALSWVQSVIGKMGGGPTGGGGPVPSGTVRDWLTQALTITNHFSQSNLSALYGRTLQESGGSPHAINLWDSNAAAGHPSKGLLQTIDSTFGSYMLPGHGNIWNPIDNAIAAIRYMFARYGHIVGPSSSGYRRGGIHGKTPGFAKGGINLPSASSILGIPALPALGGAGPQTAAGIRGVAAKISGNKSLVAGLEQSFTAIDSFYGLGTGASFVDPDTGLRDEAAIKARLDQLAVLIAYRQRIFAAWSMIVALTQRLIAANQRMARVLGAVAQSITTKGLKGNALTSANKHLTDTKAAAAQYARNAGVASGDLASAIGSRQSAWVSLQGLLGEKAGVIGTVSTPVSQAIDTVSTALDNSPVTDSATIALLQAQLQQANLTTAVSQAQFKTLPFAGSFATGGIVPGSIGQPSIIVAHGGETVTPAGQPVIELHFRPGTEWLADFVDVRVNQSTRRDSRNASRSLPGSR